MPCGCLCSLIVWVVNSVEHSVGIVFYYVCMYLFTLRICVNCVIVSLSLLGLFWVVLFGCYSFGLIGFVLRVCLLV